MNIRKNMKYTDIFNNNINYTQVLDNDVIYTIFSIMLIVTVYMLIVMDEANDTVKQKGWQQQA